MRIKKLLSLILAVLLLCGSVPIAFAETTVPAYSLSHGDTFTLGRWPQSEVKDAALLSELNSLSVQLNSYGYKQKEADADGNKQTVDMSYGDVEYGGELYRKVVINEYRPFYTGSSQQKTYYQEQNGYTAGATYWFRWDPIKWRVLANKNDGVYVLSDMILDAQAYHDVLEIITWEGCTLRTWLNENFYQSAFSDNEKNNVLNYYHQNENSPWDDTIKGGADTIDSVWILSYSDSLKSSYGFSTFSTDFDIARRAQGSDYAKSQGLKVSYSDDDSYAYYGNSGWRLRSPGKGSIYASQVDRHGRAQGDYGKNYTNLCGVRPAFILNRISSVSSVERADNSSNNNPVPPSSLSSGDTFTMGHWPQSKVTDASLISTLNSLPAQLQSYNYIYDTANRPYQTVDMYFADVEYGGEFYRKVVINRYRLYQNNCSIVHPTYSYQDENGYFEYNAYWFRWEPIKWRVLADEDDGVYVLSDIILDSQPYNNFNYGGSSLSWEYSSLRKWLNNDFYRSAFSPNEKSKMLNYFHNNEKSHWKTSVGGGADTTDKLWLLSYSDAVNSEYGFYFSESKNDVARIAQGSDYAKSQGLYVDYNTDELYGNSNWWLRSPGNNSLCGSNVIFNGSLNGVVAVNGTSNGVRPAFKLNRSSAVSSADPLDTLRIKVPSNGASLTLKSGIELSVYLDADAYGLEEGAYIEATYNKNANISQSPDIQTKTYKLSELKHYDDPYGIYTGTYKFDFKFAPAQLTEKVTLALYTDENSEEPVKTIEYSVKDYCNYVIAKSSDENLVALCKTILDYGAAAQKEFNYNTDNMATLQFCNKELIETLEVDDIKNAEFSSEFDVEGASFVCNSNLNINLIISSPVVIKGISIDGVAAYETAVKASYATSDGENYICVSGIEARYLNNCFTVSTSSGDLTMNVAFLTKRYISENRKPSEVNLAKTIYLYANAADEYFN